MEDILKTLRSEKSAAPFKVPVDAKKLNVPTYYKVITKPMDLATMAKNIKMNEYGSLDDFERDLDLIVSNCVTFNGQSAPIASLALEMQHIYQHLVQMGREKLSAN